MAAQDERVKWVPGTDFIVDGFAFQSPRCRHYFLTHMHSDHTVGLRRSFDAGTIWASPVSARLLAHEWSLRAPTVQVLQLNQPRLVDGVRVTALDANHCPGAIMLLFEVPRQGGGETRVLHTGDCRWRDGMLDGTVLEGQHVDVLMLDTTYSLPRYNFPPQQDAINSMAQVMHECLVNEPATLFVVGSYHIGKERAYLGAAQRLGLRVFAPPAKRRLLALLDLPPEQLALLTDDKGACVHVGGMGATPERLAPLLEQGQGRWRQVVGIRPTGWSYRAGGKPTIWRDGAVCVVGVPYSEHSSFSELCTAVRTLRPRRLMPTVFAEGGAAPVVARFQHLMNLSGSRNHMLFYLKPAPPSREPGKLAAVAAQAWRGGGASSLAATRQQQQVQESPDVQLQASPWQCVGGDITANGVSTDAAAAPPAGDGCVSTPAQVRGTSGGGDSSSSGGSSSSSGGSNAGGADASRTRSSSCDAAAAAAAAAFDLYAVDLEEQRRLLEQAERLQRLKRSVELQAAAKAREKRARSNGGDRGSARSRTRK